MVGAWGVGMQVEPQEVSLGCEIAVLTILELATIISSDGIVQQTGQGRRRRLLLGE